MVWQLDPTEGPGRVRRRMMRAPRNVDERHLLPDARTSRERDGGTVELCADCVPISLTLSVYLCVYLCCFFMCVIERGMMIVFFLITQHCVHGEGLPHNCAQ